MITTGSQITHNVRREGNSILKKVACGSAQVKLMQAAHLLSAETRSFYVPKVLDYDEKTQIVKMEYIPDLITLKKHIAKGKEIAHTLFYVGATLAYYHCHLELSDAERIKAPAPWTGSEPDQVVVHGDFNMTNICFSPAMDKLVILDWETSPALPFQCNWASRYLDIAQFIRSLLLQQDSFSAGLFNFQKCAKIFIMGYQKNSGIWLNKPEIYRRVVDYNMATINKQGAQHKHLSQLQSLLGNWVFRLNLKNQKNSELTMSTDFHTVNQSIAGGISG